MNTIGSNSIVSGFIKTLVKDKYGIDSGYNYYDSLTHYYLGRYLRDLRDDSGINLLSLYNCYSQNIISAERIRTTPKIIATNDGSKLSYDGEIYGIARDIDYDLISIQVLPNEVYTLYLQSDSPITIATASYNGTAFTSDILYNVVELGSTKFTRPFTYKVREFNTDERANDLYVDNLVLLIQIPKTSTKRVILLGDYTDTADYIKTYDLHSELFGYNNQIYMNVESKVYKAYPVSNKLFVINGTKYGVNNATIYKYIDDVNTTPVTTMESNLFLIDEIQYKLVYSSDQNSAYQEIIIETTPISDSAINYDHVLVDVDAFIDENGSSLAYNPLLLAYILEYAITEKDENFTNILNVQKDMTSLALSSSMGVRYLYSYNKGDLDVNMREWLKEFQTKFCSKYNAFGRVNKDVEQLLNRGGGNA